MTGFCNARTRSNHVASQPFSRTSSFALALPADSRAFLLVAVTVTRSFRSGLSCPSQERAQQTQGKAHAGGPVLRLSLCPCFDCRAVQIHKPHRHERRHSGPGLVRTPGMRFLASPPAWVMLRWSA